MKRKSGRREFLARGALAGAGFAIAAGGAISRSYAASEKLGIAAVGAGGKGSSDIDGVSSERIIALCDVDDNQASESYKRYSGVPRYRDFRKMLDEHATAIDAVLVSTPDNTHAVAAMMAIKMRKHVFVQKPLTHDVYEARALRDAVREYGVASQMGNQGTADKGLREGAEVVQAGSLGEVREVHVWTNRPIWPQGTQGILEHSGVQRALHGGGEPPAPPDHLSWDIWLGPAPHRPYDPIYAPFRWRGWWDFGTGALGDMACHTMNLPYMALNLRDPARVEAEVSVLNPETAPEWSVIRYEFPRLGERPALRLTWYDGYGGVKRPPRELFHGEQISSSGCLIVGSKGTLYSPGDYGTEYRLLPRKDFEGFQPPAPTLPRAPRGHYHEWLTAARGGPPAMSNFDYSGPLTETVLLGNVAMRAGTPIDWDAKNLKVTNNEKANRFVRREYRKGWFL